MADLTIDDARAVIDAALACAQQRGFEPLAVAVLDPGGHLVAFERDDGASYGRPQIAIAKAKGALAFGMGSRSLMNRAEEQAYFVLAAGAATGGSLVPVPGGVIARDQSGRVCGAVGVSGDTSDNDELAAIAGLEAVGLIPDTG